MKTIETAQIAGIIGDLLKTTRQERNISQAQLAKAIQCDWKDIEYWEKGNMSPPSLCSLIQLAEFFEVDIDYFTEPLREAMKSDV